MPDMLPGGALGKREVRVEFVSKGEIVKVVVARGSSSFEGAASEVCHGIFDASNGKGGKWRSLGVAYTKTQGPGKALAHLRFLAAHFGGPGDCRSVVAPDCCVGVSQVR